MEDRAGRHPGSRDFDPIDIDDGTIVADVVDFQFAKERGIFDLKAAAKVGGDVFVVSVRAVTDRGCDRSPGDGAGAERCGTGLPDCVVEIGTRPVCRAQVAAIVEVAPNGSERDECVFASARVVGLRSRRIRWVAAVGGEPDLASRRVDPERPESIQARNGRGRVWRGRRTSSD